LDITYRFDPAAPLVPEKPANTETALARLEAGNRFVNDVFDGLQIESQDADSTRSFVVPIDPVSLGLPIAPGLIPSQSPFAVVVGCTDARAPVEHLFHCSSNELNVIRIAGNSLGPDGMASVQLAIQRLADSLQAVIVLGHSDCDLIESAITRYYSKGEFQALETPPMVRALIDRILVSVDGAVKALQDVAGAKIEQAPQFRDWLSEAATYLNSAVSAYELQQAMQSWGGAAADVVYAVYDVRSTRVRALPERRGAASNVFLPPPTGTDRFGPFAIELVTRLLDARDERNASGTVGDEI
jgi:carbonic anhydrase